LVPSYDLWPGNGAGLVSKEKISKESEEKRISGEAYNVNDMQHVHEITAP